MFEAASKTLPPVDYVSMIRSLYAEPRVMMLGALASALAAGTAGIETGDPALIGVAVAFVIVGIARLIDMMAFARVQIGDEDVATASHWELRATIGAMAIAVTYGAWSFYSFVFVNTPFSEMSSLAVSVSVLVGVAGRNFAIDRLVSIQVALIGAPLALGMLLDGQFHTAMLAIVLLAFFVSIRQVSANIRAILLKAVHGRLEASRLADELDTALATMHHGLCMLDADGLIAVANGRAEITFAGFVPGSWKGRPFAAMIAAAAGRGTIPQRSAEQLLDIVNSRRNGKIVLKLAGNEYREVTVSSRQGRVVLLFEDITERVRAEERINFMAHYDALTGLPNRGYFGEQVESDLERRRDAHGTSQVTLMIVDIDDFKHVNDTAGHLIGDRLLVETAERLNRTLGDRCLVARLGGDEFIIYRSGGAEEDIQADMDAIVAAFHAPFAIMGESISADVSIGVVVSHDAEDDLDALMTKADLALYKAKGNGKGQAQLFHDDMDTAYRYRQRLKAELKVAVAAGALTLYYQPLIDLKSRRVVACEALARWVHPTLGSIPPSLFIPIAEETGIISDISRWALKTAAVECRNWPDEISVSVNVSARDFRNDDLEGMVDEALAVSGLAPERLEIEVTETALIEERDAATTILNAVGKKGVGIALDDFGTGYSSLSYLQALPFTKLKVDRSFVREIGSNPRALKLLSNVAQLGKDINLVVTAEGVETEEQLALISAHTKVDLIQGYLFGIPLPSRDLAELIQRMARSAEDNGAKRAFG
ncbi:MAG TPA: EAL domain-containing protein [Devosia sp.]|nr:EAL domain-containing protein [Devosia sp.]